MSRFRVIPRSETRLTRQQMYDIYDLFAPMPEPLIPRPLRLEVRVTGAFEVQHLVLVKDDGDRAGDFLLVDHALHRGANAGQLGRSGDERRSDQRPSEEERQGKVHDGEWGTFRPANRNEFSVAMQRWAPRTPRINAHHPGR